MADVKIELLKKLFDKTLEEGKVRCRGKNY